MREEQFIDVIKQALPQSAGYIGDDTAYIPEKDLILTQDTLIEGIHFKQETISPYYLGRKSIAVNLSDIAASGGIPKYILISLSMPKNIRETFVKEFYQGVNSICNEYKTLVVGGDLTASGNIMISVCAVGSGNGLNPATRKNSKPGDFVVVTGEFGSSKAGLEALENKETGSKFIQAHINPSPRINEGRKILQAAGNPAMMDASDGLADALYKISEASGVSMDIDFISIPHDDEVKDDWVLFGGEDYELVATVSEQAYEALKKEIFIKKIGTVKEAIVRPHVNVSYESGEVLIIDKHSFGDNPVMFRHFE